MYPAEKGRPFALLIGFKLKNKQVLAVTFYYYIILMNMVLKDSLSNSYS